MKTTYEIQEIDRYTKKSNGVCISDGPDREQVIKDAASVFEMVYGDNDSFGDHSEDVMLVWFDDAGEHEQKITIEFIVERDLYDGGRSDYYFQQMGV